MKVKNGDAWIRVIKNGVVHNYTEAEYLDEFGLVVVKPVPGKSLFGGRYSHSTFADAHTATGTTGTSHANTGSFDVNQEEHTL